MTAPPRGVIAHGPDGLVLRRLDLRKDAEALAAMWRASDDQWPGGHLVWIHELEVPARGSRAATAYVVLAESVDEVKAYRALPRE